MVAIGVGLCLLLAGAYGGYNTWSTRRAEGASDALSEVRSDYLAALGASPNDLDLPELANPEAARQIREEFAGHFRGVAEDYSGTTAGSLAWIEVAEILGTEGRFEEAIETLRQALGGTSRSSALRAITLQHMAKWQEEAGLWAEAAQSHQSAGEIAGFSLRHWALADAARCFARAGDSERALALFDQIETEAPEWSLPPHLRSLARELRSGGSS
jgi:tetratricopeptide (TPR) repeat protein